METFLDQYGLFVVLGIGICGILFGLVLTILERKLLVTRKPVAGVSGFSVTMYGCAVTAFIVWLLTENVLCFGLVIVAAVALYAIICFAVEKKEYPESERFTKE